MSDVLIKVERLHKKFCATLKRGMAYGAIDISKTLLGMDRKSHTLRPGEFWALQDINFTLNRGEILGIIGANGAGKSTLLRVLNGIYPPDVGRIEVHGGIGGLIALGAGFHPYLSGRENIFLNGTILGMPKSEIKKNLDSIIDFADIGEFIESPVSTYSSGMYARLGFSIAIHCVPDILLIDEVLSVGDMSFQNKCLRKISDLRRGARGVIFVGHNMDMIETICDKAILLHENKVHASGHPLDVIAAYRTISREREHASDQREYKSKIAIDVPTPYRPITFINARISDPNGKTVTKIQLGEDLHVYYEFRANMRIEKPLAAVGLSHPSIYPSNVIYDSNDLNQNIKIPALEAGQSYRLHAQFKKPNLIPGVYRLNVLIREGHQSETAAHLPIEGEEVTSFIFEGQRSPYNSLISLESKWSCEVI